MAGVTQQVKCAERIVVVRELTVGEVRQWLADLDEAAKSNAPLDAVGEFMADGISFEELRRFTDLAADDMDALTESDLARVTEAAKKLNPGFFRVRGRLVPAAPPPRAAT